MAASGHHHDIARWVYLFDQIMAPVYDVEVARSIDRNSRWSVQGGTRSCFW